MADSKQSANKETKKELTPQEKIKKDYQTFRGSIYDLAKKHGVRVNDVYRALGQHSMVKKIGNDDLHYD